MSVRRVRGRLDENRLVAAGLEAARGLCRHEAVRRRVNRSRAIFADACDHRALDARWVDGPYEYDRRNEHYRVPHEYARLLLRGLAVRDLFALGATKSFVFMVDMNRVFEDFVARLLQTAVADLGLEIGIQHRLSGRIIESQTGRTYRSIIPDLVLRGPTAQGPREIPVDAKYKLYGERSIDNADLYQLFFYAFVHRPATAPPGSSGLPSAFIVYPVSGGSRVDLVFTDLRGVAGARLTGIGLDVPAALDAIRNRTTQQLPLVAALKSVFEAAPGVIAA